MNNVLLTDKLYIEDLESIICSTNFDSLKNKSIMIPGATGMIGSLLVDALMHANKKLGTSIKVLALGRNIEKAKKRFPYFGEQLFQFMQCDISNKNTLQVNESIDIIIHLASTTHPLAYATDPIGTITSNVYGTMNLLDLGVRHNIQKFILASSVEIYGENNGDKEYFTEDYCGYINPNTLRAGYPESKRVSEALCQAFIQKYGIDISIPRLSRVFGPTMLASDSKALSQFLKKAVNHENIVLKSSGTQKYSYCYSADAVSALLAIIISGEKGEAYNVSGTMDCNITLRNLAELIAKMANTNIRFEVPDEMEQAGYSKATKALLDIDKIRTRLNWVPKYSIEAGISRTISILQHLPEFKQKV